MSHSSLLVTTRALLLFCSLGTASQFTRAAEPTVGEPALSGTSAIHIVLVGDSTVTDKAGWGKAFAILLRPEVRCTNTSSGGQSSKSFLDGGRWKKALELHPTHVLIQFGHNDMPGKGPNRETVPETTYRANLMLFVDEARAAGAQPVLVTSIPRRTFDGAKLRGELAPYVAAMKKVATEKNVPLADLYLRGIEAVERLGPEKSEELGPLLKDGKRDHTHLSPSGMEFTANQLATELRKVVPEFAAFLRSPITQ